MSDGPELPVIYENPRFDKATPTLKPVFDRAMRAGLVLMLEWGTLTVIESSPAYLKWATIVVAILGLSVHESWPWLRMRDRRWYPSLMAALVISYLSIAFYALYTTPVQRSSQPPQAMGLFNEATPKPPAPPRSKETINELLQESAAIQKIIERGAPLVNQWQSITVLNPHRVCLDLDIHSFDERIQPVENGLDAAQTELNSIFARNSIDSAEFVKIFGSSMIGAGSNGFGIAAQVLRGYRDGINQLGNHPACDNLMRSNRALFLYVDMMNGLSQYSTWINKSKESVERYRDNLRRELRNAP